MTIPFACLKNSAFLFLTMILLSGQVFGQSSTVKITDLDSFLKKSKSSNQRVLNSDSQHVADLIYNTQPAVYLTTNDIKEYGDNPTTIYTDISALVQLKSTTLMSDSIEIIIIKINNKSELNSTIDLSAFSNFNNLKYLYFTSSVNIASDDISKMIKNYTGSYSIFYKVQQADN